MDEKMELTPELQKRAGSGAAKVFACVLWTRQKPEPGK